MQIISQIKKAFDEFFHLIDNPEIIIQKEEEIFWLTRRLRKEKNLLERIELENKIANKETNLRQQEEHNGKHRG